MYNYHWILLDIQIDKERVDVFDLLSKHGTVPKPAGHAPKVILIILALYQSPSIIF
jgi:hypothetical protein